jgi:pyrroloquinoline quinone (PQQ) biosynthesis protein C
VTRCIVILDQGTREQQDRITSVLSSSSQHQRFAWWHHIENVWLLANVPAGTTPKSLWTQIAEATGLRDARILVIMFNNQVSHYGKLSGEAWPWMAEHFGVSQ